MPHIANFLQQILQRKREEIEYARERKSTAQLKQELLLADAPRGFVRALKNRVRAHHAAVIAEIKRASPSQGVIRQHFNPLAIAQSYAQAGATCLSVLTDEDFFHGQVEHLIVARSATTLPVLRKDFIIDPYQVYQTRAMGADCVLLIVAALDDVQLAALYKLARDLMLDALIEVHNAEELQRALALSPQMIGVNNRNLRTFTTSLNTSLELIEQIPQRCLLVTESGIHCRADVALMRAHGIHSFLVGEAMMRAENPGDKLRELFFSSVQR